mgnify:CR=1 FL=1
MPENTQTPGSTPPQPQSSSGESSTGVGQSSAYPTKAEFDTLAEKQKSDQNFLLAIMVGVVIFLTVTFVVEIYTTNLDRIKDKDLYLRYNDLYEQYEKKNSELGDKVSDQRIEINDLRNEIEMLRARNQYLK